MLAPDRNRLLWCTPGYADERILVDILSSTGWTITRQCIDAADLLGAVSVEPESVVVVSSAIQRLDAALWSSICDRAAAVFVLQGTADGPVPLGGRGHVTIDVGSATEQLPRALLSFRPGSNPGDDGGQVVTVWGTSGAPGRTTVAIGLAEACARRNLRVCLIDADTYAPAVAPSLAVVEQASGLLLACKHADQGSLDEYSLTRALRSIRPGLDILTGIDDPVRWPEVRPDSFLRVRDLCRSLFDVTIIDTHDCVEITSDPVTAMRGERNGITQAAVKRADHVVIVARPDPVGVTRLVRSLAAVADISPDVRSSVVVNRARRSGDPREVRSVLARVGRPMELHSVPEDRAVTRAAARGSLLGELRGRSAARAHLGKIAARLMAA